MDVIKALQYFISEDGPHISIQTLSVYCGLGASAMRDYIRGKYKPSPEIRAQIEKGLSEMIKEMQSEWPI